MERTYIVIEKYCSKKCIMKLFYCKHKNFKYIRYLCIVSYSHIDKNINLLSCLCVDIFKILKTYLSFKRLMLLRCLYSSTIKFIAYHKLIGRYVYFRLKIANYCVYKSKIVSSNGDYTKIVNSATVAVEK